MLGDFNFLHHLPQRGAVTRSIFTNDPHLLGALGLCTLTKDINIVSLQYTRNILLATSATALKASSGAIERCAHWS